MRRALQQQFQAKEDATGAPPMLSVDALTAAMTKREAARIFYQICGTFPSPVGQPGRGLMLASTAFV